MVLSAVGSTLVLGEEEVGSCPECSQGMFNTQPPPLPIKGTGPVAVCVGLSAFMSSPILNLTSSVTGVKTAFCGRGNSPCSCVHLDHELVTEHVPHRSAYANSGTESTGSRAGDLEGSGPEFNAMN